LGLVAGNGASTSVSGAPGTVGGNGGSAAEAQNGQARNGQAQNGQAKNGQNGSSAGDEFVPEPRH